jgi:hypothetical protein
MSALSSALRDIQGPTAYNATVSTIYEQIRNYSQLAPDEMPAVFPIDADERMERATFNGLHDTSADLTVIITSMLHNSEGVTPTARADILQDIGKCVTTASQLSGITAIWFVEVTKVATDMGTIPEYSIHDQEVHFHYYYQSTDGG